MKDRIVRPEDGSIVFGIFCVMERIDSEGKKEYMLRALELAARGRGRTSPNPMVGAVVVRDDRVAGEGFHEMAGADHAEVRALTEAGERARGGDLYVNLEPCSHYGRTPPCTAAIGKAGIGRVFAAISDPNPLVAGKGAAQLRESGIEVRIGMAGEEARRLNEAYLKHIVTGLPFVFLKSAVSLDGKTATRTGDSQWISSEESRARVHEMRDGADAIMIGIGTVLADNPRLTTRLAGGGGTSPARIVIDPLLRIPPDARILEMEEGARTTVVTTPLAPPEKIELLRAADIEVIVAAGEERVVDLRLLMEDLGARGVTSVMIEGGAETAASALSFGIVDKIVYFIAPKIVGGRGAPSAVGGEGTELMKGAVELRDVRYTALGDNIMVEAYLSRGGA